MLCMELWGRARLTRCDPTRCAAVVLLWCVTTGVVDNGPVSGARRTTRVIGRDALVDKVVWVGVFANDVPCVKETGKLKVKLVLAFLDKMQTRREGGDEPILDNIAQG